MAKAKLSPVFDEVSGAYGDLVFKEVKGKTIWAHKPNQKDGPNTAQVAFTARALRAKEYAKLVEKDPDLLALYQEVAEKTGISVYNLSTADFRHKPVVVDINPLDYNGKVGDVIKIVATDDFGVVRAIVTLSDADEGTLIEKGEAVLPFEGTAYWKYTATKAVPAGTTVSIRVEAYDRPYGMGMLDGTKRIEQLD